MSALSDQAAFLKAIAADPSDQAIRGIYADWLEEHGEHELAAEQRNWAAVTEDSRTWLLEYALRFNNYDPPEEAYKNLIDGLKNGDLRKHGSTDMVCVGDLDDAQELRMHAERIGIKMRDWSEFSFSCSC